MSRNPIGRAGKCITRLLAIMHDVPSEVITCALSAEKVVADDVITLRSHPTKPFGMIVKLVLDLPLIY